MAAPTPPEISLYVNGFFSVNTNHIGRFDRGDYSIREDFTLEHGAHEIHIGGEALHISNNLVNTYNMSGNFTFGSALSGSNLSDFLLGTASNFTQGGGEYKNLAGVLWSLYVQDNIRVSSKLKVEAGVRWDPYFPYTEQKGRVRLLLAGYSDPSTRFPNAPLACFSVAIRTVPTADRKPIRSQHRSPPRVSLIRSARTQFCAAVQGSTTRLRAITSRTAWWIQRRSARCSTTRASSNFANPYSSIGIPNPFPAQYASTPASDVQFTLPVSIYGTFQHNWHMPELATWNLNLEHQFGHSWVGRASYAGNKGTYLASGVLGFNEQNPAVYIPGASTLGEYSAAPPESAVRQRGIVFVRQQLSLRITAFEYREEIQPRFFGAGELHALAFDG